MNHITNHDVFGWSCTCGDGEEFEIERDEYTGSIKNYNAHEDEAYKRAALHEAEMRGTDPVYCRCGQYLGEQDALYALQNPNAAQDQREGMLCPVCDVAEDT